jgi:hypothetical protein
MDLKLMCQKAVNNVKLAHLNIEIDEYTKVLGYATYEMEAFDILLNKVEELNKQKAQLMNVLNSK